MPEVEHVQPSVQGFLCFGFYDVSQIATWLIDTYAKPLRERGDPKRRRIASHETIEGARVLRRAGR